MNCTCECFTDHTIKPWRKLPFKTHLNSSKPLYLVVSQQIACWWLCPGCLIFYLLLSLDQSDGLQRRHFWTPGWPTVDKTTQAHFSVSSSSAVLYKHFLSSWGLTLFCKLSSCSLYHLSFSSRTFFSSSSFFTKSISLGRKQGNVVFHQTFSS